jgi:DNA-binding transcriptional ArsR family regulator
MQALAALSDPIRREIVETLLDHPEDAGSIASHFDVSRPAVSRHLRVLREAGLVTVKRDAQRRIYHAAPEPLAEVDAWFAKYRPFWADKLDALGAYLEQETTQ